MHIFKKILLGRSKVDKAELIRVLVDKRINESWVLQNFGAALGVEDASQMNLLQLLSLPEAGIVTIVETYVAQRRKGKSSEEILTAIERHRSRLCPGARMPTPLNLESFVKYRVKLEMPEMSFPISDEFINFSIKTAMLAHTSDEESAKWLRETAEHECAIAPWILGVMYYRGLGVPQDDTESAKYFCKAAVRGDAGAQYAIGAMYYDGKGVSKNDAEAIKWFRKAADQGNADAQNMLKEFDRN